MTRETLHTEIAAMAERLIETGRIEDAVPGIKGKPLAYQIGLLEFLAQAAGDTKVVNACEAALKALREEVNS